MPNDWFGPNDKIEKATLNRLTRIYGNAAKTAIKRQKAFFKKVQDVESGKIQPPQYYIDTNQVDKWRQGYLTEALRQQKVIDGIMEDLNRAGEMAAGTIDDANVDIYSNTRSQQADSLKKEAKEALYIEPTFTTYNKRQIGVLIKDQQSPFSKIAYRNLGQNTEIRRKLQATMANAIILGESQQKMLKRIQTITGQTYSQAKRVAQTERTRVQAQATHEVVMEAHEQGIRTYKKWSCKMMPTSRDSHRDLNDRCEYSDDPFETIWGNSLMYPGDISAPANEVCNCHCIYIEHVLLPDEEIRDGKVVKMEATTSRKSLMDKAQDDIIQEEMESASISKEENLIHIPKGYENEQRFETTEEIAKYFTWEDQYGQLHSPIDIETWESVPITQRKAAANGIDYAMKRLGLKWLPEKIMFDNLTDGRNGTYGGGILRISNGLQTSPKTTFATAFHELVHFIDSGTNSQSAEILKEALTELEWTKASVSFKNNAMKTTGQNKLNKYAKDPRELLAFSLEKEATGRILNPLSSKITEIFWRRRKNGK